MRVNRLLFLALAAVSMLCLAGCALSRTGQVDRADRDAYAVISEKMEAVSGRAPAFSIDFEPGAPGSLDRYPGEGDSGPAVLSLADTLEIAARHSREYQERREQLYLRALALTSQRHLYEPRVSGAGGTLGAERSGGSSRLSAGLNLSLLQWLADGARLTLDLSGNFARLLSGDPRETIGLAAGFNVFQPFFRGAGRAIAQENLTRAERETIYQVRSFLRYQRSFSVDIAGRWFQLAQQAKILENEEANYRRLADNLERVGMLGEAGRVPMIQVDQARQDTLAAEERLVVSRAAYRQALDNFKVRLGLPPGVDLRLRDEDLDALLGREIPWPALDLEAAREKALAGRLDLLNTRDAVEDAGRAVEIAADALRPRLDLRASHTLNARVSGPGSTSRRTALGLEGEIPVDRVNPGNAYRQALLSFDQSRRAAALFADNVELQVRDAWGTLEQARQSLEIEMRSLELARRRTEGVNLLMDAGRASQRDVQEAQASLLQAQNAVVRTVVSYYRAYLEFLRDTELLPIGANGVWTGGFDA